MNLFDLAVNPEKFFSEEKNKATTLKALTVFLLHTAILGPLLTIIFFTDTVDPTQSFYSPVNLRLIIAPLIAWVASSVGMVFFQSIQYLLQLPFDLKQYSFFPLLFLWVGFIALDLFLNLVCYCLAKHAKGKGKFIQQIYLSSLIWSLTPFATIISLSLLIIIGSFNRLLGEMIFFIPFCYLSILAIKAFSITHNISIQRSAFILISVFLTTFISLIYILFRYPF